MIVYRDAVQARLKKLYSELSNGERKLTKKIARVLMMTLEHEGLHAEVHARSVVFVLLLVLT